jgi:hypothetical protein
VVEVWLARGAGELPDLPSAALETAIFLLLGVLHAARPWSDWRGSAAWPGALLVGGALARMQGMAPMGLLGVAVTVVVVVRVAEDLPRWMPWTLLGGVVARLACLVHEARPRSAVMAETLRGAPALLAALPHPVVLATLPLAWWRPAVEPAAVGPSVLLVTVDTLRWDEMQAMEARKSFPGACWARAMSTSNWTVPALASLHTGRLDHGAGVGTGNTARAIRADVPTLAETLTAAGWRTAAFVENAFVAEPLGFARGFPAWWSADASPFVMAATGAPARASPIEKAGAWIGDASAHGEFTWVHIDDPHLPYRRYPVGDDAFWRAAGADRRLLALAPIRAGLLRLGPEGRAALREAYRGEVRAVDAELVDLFALARRRWPDGIFVLTADHGEEFWDHGGFEHGHSHHGEVVDVGLCLAGPGIPEGERADLASLQDVAPTVLGMVGLPAGGVDLRDAIPADRVAYASGALYDGATRSARQGSLRAIVGVGEYDLSADPTEVLPSPPGELTRRAATLELGPQGQEAEVEQEELRALGYLF